MKTYTIISLFILLHAFILNSSVNCTSKLVSIPLVKLKSPIENMIESGISSEDAILNLKSPSSPPRTNDSIPLYKFLDSQFYASVGFGHPLQPINIIFDTTWGDNWVISSKCSWFYIACAFRKKYDPSKSSSFVDLHNSFNISLGKSVLAGEVVNDTVYITHTNVTNQTFGAVTALPMSYVFSAASGVIGLGFKDLTRWSQSPILYAMYNQKKIAKAVFSIYINRKPDTDHGGSIFFGGSDPKHYNGSFSYFRVTSDNYWQFDLNSIQLIYSKKKGEIICAKKCSAILDTSSTAITGPKQSIDKINSIIGGKYFLFGFHLVSCSTISHLPHLSFVIGLKNYTLTGEDYIQRVMYGGIQICLSSFVESVFKDNYTWTLGVAFLSQFYTEFDIGERRIGFAQLKQ